MRAFSIFCLAALCLAASPASAVLNAVSPLDHKVTSIDGKPVELSQYKGKVVLIVNVASRCGKTYQYEALQKLHEQYKDKGLVILGFPCNQFGAQEPGTEKQIVEFCTSKYGVSFPMFSKIEVNGPEAAPLYKYLTSEDTNPKHAGKISWNFEKFLIGRDGQVIQRYRPGVDPDAAEVIAAIQKAIASN